MNDLLKPAKHTASDSLPLRFGGPLTRRGALGALVAAALSLAVAGCGKKQAAARLTPLSDDAVILVYAAGIGEEGDFFRSTQMDEALQNATKRKVVSMGQGGSSWRAP